MLHVFSVAKSSPIITWMLLENQPSVFTRWRWDLHHVCHNLACEPRGKLRTHTHSKNTQTPPCNNNHCASINSKHKNTTCTCCKNVTFIINKNCRESVRLIVCAWMMTSINIDNFQTAAAIMIWLHAATLPNSSSRRNAESQPGNSRHTSQASGEDLWKSKHAVCQLAAAWEGKISSNF